MRERPGTEPAQPAPVTVDEQSVLDAHETFWQAYARRDLDLRFSVCAEDVTFFGTGLHERAVGKAQYRAMNQKGVEQYPEPFTIDTLWRTVRVLSGMAWVECDTLWIQHTGGITIKEVVRITTIFSQRDGQWCVVHVHGSEPDYRLQEGEYMTNASIVQRNRELERQVMERTKELQQEKARSDDLLLNILPGMVADELKANGTSAARLYTRVTVLFTDFKNFTHVSELLSPQQLVDELHACFTAFDHLLGKYRVEKIKTVGDAYLAVAGLPAESDDHATDVVHLALDIRDYIRTRKTALGEKSFDIRIGVHSGEVVAGIVGIRKFAYDIWGDTVNTAARMEQNCPVGEVNISSATHELVKDHFHCTYRGEIDAKNKGLLKMYLARRSSEAV